MDLNVGITSWEENSDQSLITQDRDRDLIWGHEWVGCSNSWLAEGDCGVLQMDKDENELVELRDTCETST